jgi:hypothetical protein
VSDISVAWVAVARSPWRDRLRRTALAASCGVAAAIVLMLMFRSGVAAGVAGALAALAVGCCSWRNRATPGAQWRVWPDGRVGVRWDDEDAPAEARPAFHSSFLIVLRRGGRTLAVWRDAAPPAAFRRLSAAVRWRIDRRAPTDSLPDAADRT